MNPYLEEELVYIGLNRNHIPGQTDQWSTSQVQECSYKIAVTWLSASVCTITFSCTHNFQIQDTVFAVRKFIKWNYSLPVSGGSASVT